MWNIKCEISNVKLQMSNVKSQKSKVKSQISNIKWQMTNVECQYMTKAVSSFQIRLLLFLGCTVCCLNHFSNLSKSIYFLLLFRPLEILLPGSHLNFPPQIIGYIWALKNTSCEILCFGRDQNLRFFCTLSSWIRILKLQWWYCNTWNIK